VSGPAFVQAAGLGCYSSSTTLPGQSGVGRRPLRDPKDLTRCSTSFSAILGVAFSRGLPQEARRFSVPQEDRNERPLSDGPSGGGSRPCWTCAKRIFSERAPLSFLRRRVVVEIGCQSRCVCLPFQNSRFSCASPFAVRKVSESVSGWVGDTRDLSPGCGVDRLCKPAELVAASRRRDVSSFLFIVWITLLEGRWRWELFGGGMSFLLRPLTRGRAFLPNTFFSWGFF